MVTRESFEQVCDDGVRISGDEWTPSTSSTCGSVVIAPATGVLASYYHRYARFLAEAGLRVLTFDYRGIGRSRPAKLRRCRYRWRDWGERDFDAVLRMALAGEGPVLVVGHSIGGFLPGYSRRADRIDRMLTVGAQYAYWRDYAAGDRARLFVKWHLAMPALTWACGYFPGRRLGWLEDLPKGVANEWSFRRARMEESYPADERSQILARFSAVTGSILALGVSDDEIATPRAIARALDYYGSASKAQIQLTPEQLDCERIGHFGLFHDRFRARFWGWSVDWLLGAASDASPRLPFRAPCQLDGDCEKQEGARRDPRPTRSARVHGRSGTFPRSR